MPYEIIGHTRYFIQPVIDICPHCGAAGSVGGSRSILDPRFGDTTTSCSYYYFERDPARFNPASPSHPARVQHFDYSCYECFYTWWVEDPGAVSNLRKTHKQERENLRRLQAFQMRIALRPGLGTGQHA